MKYCPECHQTYTDETLKFCREDGTPLQVNVSSLNESSDTLSLPAARTNDALPTKLLQSEATQSEEVISPIDTARNLPTSGASDVHTSSSSEYFLSGIKRRKRGVAIVLLVMLLAASGLGLWFFSSRLSRARQIESIAVLPFVNESGNADVEYLSDGMTEILIGSLSQLPNLNVKARTSIFRYKGKEIDPRQVASDLKVQAILTGRVLQRANSLTLYVELIDTATENVLWKADYNRSMTDLVALQNEIAHDVSQKLRSRLSEADTQKLIKKNDTTNPEAYRLYLQGRFFWNKRRITLMGKAIGYFQQAIELDPNYALAYAGLADAIAQPNDVVPHLERAEKARAAVQKALSLNPDLAEAHTSLAHIILRYDLDFAGAERELNRALELDPRWPDIYQRFGELYSALGRHDEALTRLRHGIAIEPFNLPLNTGYGGALTNARRYDEAIAQLKKTIELDPNHRNAHVMLSTAYAMKGMNSEAVQHRITALQIAEQDQWAESIREGFAKAGWRGFLLAEYERFAALGNSADRLPHFNEAATLAMLGEKEKAFAALDQSLAAREQPSLFFLKVDPRFDPLRSDPRFQDLLRRVGFSP